MLVGGIFLVWSKRMQPEPPQNQTLTEEAVNTPKVEHLDTSDWKTYRNEEFGFKFKYPTDWLLEEKNDKYDDRYVFRYLSLKPLDVKGITIEVGVKNNFEGNRTYTRSWHTGFAVSDFEPGGKVANGHSSVEKKYGVYQAKAYNENRRNVRLIFYCAPGEPLTQCNNFQIENGKSAFIGAYVDNDDISGDSLKNMEQKIDALFSTLVSF